MEHGGKRESGQRRERHSLREIVSVAAVQSSDSAETWRKMERETNCSRTGGIYSSALLLVLST